MSAAKYRFSIYERHAVFTVHGEKCYLCGRLLDMLTMEVDHILPEVLGNDEKKRKEVFELFGLPSDFDLNAYGNWKPACGPCNGKKRAAVFEPHPIHRMHLDDAIKQAGKAAKIAEEVVKVKELQSALVTVVKAGQQGLLTDSDKTLLAPLALYQVTVREPATAREPIRFTPFYEVLSDDGLIQVVRGPYGVGGRPSMPNPHPSFHCPTCGAGAAFNGTICVRCGTMSDGD